MPKVASGHAKVRVEFEDGRVFAFEGSAFICEDKIDVRYETPKGRLVREDRLDRTEVCIHAKTTPHS